jgi:hypothetical protein
VLHTDALEREDFLKLAETRAPVCISIFMPTHPVSTEAEKDRIRFKTLAADALRQLEQAALDKRLRAEFEENLQELQDDEEFWRFQAHGLAVFLSPDGLRTFRLPEPVEPGAEVGDRFHVKPLLRTLTTPREAFVLALSQNAVRLVESTPSRGFEIKVEGLPASLGDALRISTPIDRAPKGRLQGGEGMKVRLRKFCRLVDRAIRQELAGRSEPLILACDEPLAVLYRSVNTYPSLHHAVLGGNPEERSADELSREAQAIVGEGLAARIAEAREAYAAKIGTGLATDNVEKLARAAVVGQIDTLMVELSAPVYGRIDSDTGAVERHEEASFDGYNILDKIAALTARYGGEVLALEPDQMPVEGQVAAVLRFG